MAYSLSIDWSGAEVVAARGSLEVQAPLDGEPDATWRNVFDTLREDARIEAVTRSDQFYVEAVRVYSNEVCAGGFAAGAEDEVRRVLDDLVARTNEQAARSAKADTERRESERQAADALARDAKAATSRFRSGS